MSAPLIAVVPARWEMVVREIGEDLSDLHETYAKSLEVARASRDPDDAATCQLNLSRYLRCRSKSARRLVQLGHALACSSLNRKGEEQ